MYSFREDVERAVQYHGHLCSGQCIGVKIGRAGLRELGLNNDDPKDRKKIMVYVECDRCPADSISIVTGTRIGKRTLKVKDFGKVAATFVNLETGKAVRVARMVRKHPQEGEDMIAFYENLPEEGYLQITPVQMDIPACDMPGPPAEAVTCAMCGEGVTDSRHVVRDKQTLCKACAGETYYKELTL